MKETVDLKEFVGGFIAESDQLVASATAWLLEIEHANAAGTNSPKTVRDLFRALHTLKGLAGMMGIQAIVDLSHAMETVLRNADQAGGQLGPRTVELGLIAIREIAERVRCVAENRAVAPAPDAVLDELARADVAGKPSSPAVPVVASWDRKLSPGERHQLAAAIEAGRTAFTLSFAPSDANTARGITITSVRAAVCQIGDIIKVSPHAQDKSADAPAGLVFELLVASDRDAATLAKATGVPVERITTLASERPQPATLPQLRFDDAPSPISGRSVVRVDLSRLDELQEQLGALVVTRFRLQRQIAQLSDAGADVRALAEIADAQSRQLRDLRRSILRVRMVRLAETLEPLSLVVRSLAKPGIKEVRLEVDVRDAELDKAVADRLLPALVHLVRNAIDHAIEPVIDRERAGKPRAGVVRISSQQGAGNQLLLSVSDDGRGIDRNELAARSGKSADDDVAALEIMTTPGFSTRDVATETSGRGLGMDIVKRIVVNELGGEILLRSERGVGTTFTLEVPLTIAIIDVFSFECAQQPFVVPVSSIEEIFELADQQRTATPKGSRGHLPVTLCERRGRPLPIISLGTMLRIADANHDPKKALVIRRSGEPIAFAVDRMLGRHEVLVRPIEDTLARVPGIAGATDLGDGRPTLLLDLVELSAGINGWRAQEQRS